jgi:hypothetical protein
VEHLKYRSGNDRIILGWIWKNKILLCKVGGNDLRVSLFVDSDVTAKLFDFFIILDIFNNCRSLSYINL